MIPPLPDASAGALAGALSVGSLFSGIGGLELGLEMGLGSATTLWQVEYEEHARLLLGQHWPDAEKHKDVRHVGHHNLAPVDLICGGFPCQPHSVAGKRQSSADERDLWGEFARIIGELRPRWVVAENVPGLLSSHDPAFFRDHPGGFFGRVLRDLAALGFDAEWHCFPAAAVGAHHIRQRVFIVAWDMDNTQRLGWSARGHHHSEHDGHVAGATGEHSRALAHPSGAGREEQHAPAEPGSAGYGAGRSDARDVADAEQREGQYRHDADVQWGRTRPAQQVGLGSSVPTWAGGDWEQPHPLTAGTQSGLRGVADGVPLRVDRLTRLGNGVVPQQAAVIGRAIREAEAHWRLTGHAPERIVLPHHVRGAA